jgi:hypothetical protein
MSLPPPRFRIAPLAKELCEVRGFSQLQTFFPTLTKLFRLNKHQTDGIWMDSKWRITGIDISGTSGPCSLKLVKNDISNTTDDVKEHNAYLKVTHLLDPIRWMKGRYTLPNHNGLPWHAKTWGSACKKIQDSWNQAYVETVASYALGRLRDEGVSPHFNEFYGAFCARADTYRYNLTDDFSNYRNSKWFWEGQANGFFKLCVLDPDDPSEPIPEEILNTYLQQPSIIDSNDSDDSDYSDDSSSNESNSVEELESDDIDTNGIEIYETDMDINNEDTASLHSDEMTSISFAGSETDTDSSSSVEDTRKIYSEIHNFPVMLIAVEQNSGTMDSLLDNIEEVGAKHGTPEWDLRWSAWIFQVVAALTVAQTIIGFTHNDLHTNNIVWIPTKEEFLYYTLKSGATFKVPTFGKLFRIIDFGRAIFTINKAQFISDDFRVGNDADGQYSFYPLHENPDEEVLPNPSFDLCRLAVSLFEALYPNRPDELEGGNVLSSEDGFVVNETVSPLCNCLWSWMIDDFGANVLLNPDGSERFPDFDLYKHIAAYVHVAIPSQQFTHPTFDQFQINPSEVGDVRKWQLFV